MVFLTRSPLEILPFCVHSGMVWRVSSPCKAVLYGKFQGALRAPKHFSLGAQTSKLVARIKISRSPSGSQAFQPGCPGLSSWLPEYIWWNFFLCTRILLACWSPKSAILAFGFDKNPHVVLWNPSKFSCHSDLKPETWAMPPNCLGLKEGKVKNFSRFT